MEATIDTTTTTPTPESVPAAPATSAPDSTSTPVQRPSSMLQAFEQVAAKQDASAASAPAATVQAPAAVPPGVTPDTPGPKLSDHKIIIENTRTKTRAEVLAEVDRTLGWARQVAPEHAPKVLNFYQAMERDPVAFYHWLGETLAAHPTFGSQVRSNGNGSRSADAMPEPDVQIIDEQGRVTGMTYSDKRQAEKDAYLKRSWFAEVNQQYAPLREEHERRVAEKAAADHTTRATTQVDTTLARVDKILDGDKAAWQRLSEVMEVDPHADVIDLALKVREDVIKPALEQRVTAQVQARHQQKAGANTANGNGTATTPPARPRNAKELAAFMDARDGR